MISRSLSLLLAASAASAASATSAAADPSFYVVSIADKGNAILFSDAQTAPKDDLPYAVVGEARTTCCFRAGARRHAAGAAGEGDLMSEEDRPVFRHAGHVRPPARPEPDLGYGFVGMQAVAQKGRDTVQVTLHGGDPVFVRTCYTGEGLQLRLFHRLADRKPYASYYYYLGYDVERTCR